MRRTPMAPRAAVLQQSFPQLNSLVQFIHHPLRIILLKQRKSPFKGNFEPTAILLCVRWYCRYQLPERDLEEMMRECGL